MEERAGSGYDIFLDAEESADGRPTSDVIIDKFVIPAIYYPYYYPPPKVYEDFAYYERGNKRHNMNRRMTIEELKGFLWHVQSEGGCRCKEYFGVK